MTWQVVDDDEVVAEFPRFCDFYHFIQTQKRIGIIKKEIERVERNKLSEFLRNVKPENEEHRKYLIVWFESGRPKWKQRILDLYVYGG